MDTKQLEQTVARLRSTMPLVGGWLRRAACRKLAVDSGADTVPYLIGALTIRDAEVVAIADSALRSLREPDAVDALCGLWAQNRDERLGRFVSECTYVARKPVDVRVLSALKAGKAEVARESSGHIVALVTFLSDRDPAIAQCAEQSLRSLRAPDAVDALCAIWAKDRDERLGRFVSECNYVAQKPVDVRVLSALKAGQMDVACESGKHISALVAALSDRDSAVAQCAEQSLRSLRAPDAVDALCAIWAKDRDERLGRFVSECKYVAQKPVDVRVLSTLKAGKADVAGESSGHIVALVTSLSDRDPAIAQCAEQSLRSLREPDVVDALCALWAQNRDERLGRYVSECKYVAHKPVDVRVLTALKAGKIEVASESGAHIAALVTALTDHDPAVVQCAEQSLRSAREPEAIDALCGLAMRDPSSAVARICVERGFRPRDPEDMCLFLCVTRQFDAYFQEDFEFQNLRPAYDRADAQVRAQVLAVVRSGDRRWQGFLGVRKPVSYCTAAEIELTIESSLRHQDWPRLWSLFKQVAFIYTWRTLRPMLDSGWKPENKDDRETFDAVFEAANGSGARTTQAVDRDPYSFADLLAEGRNGNLARKTEAELLTALQAASPPDAIPIVGAIGARLGANCEAARAVMASPHWMVRLAGSVAGLGQLAASDSIVTEGFTLTKSNLESFWPLRVMPEDLENLRTWPLESVAEDARPMYLVLEQLMIALLSAGTFTEVIIEAAEDAGEFEEVK